MPEQHRFGGVIVLSTPTDTAPTGQAVGAVYLDDGTNTGSGSPEWRRLTSTGPDVWEDMGGGGGAPLSSVWLGGDYTYTQAAVPVEEVIGGGSFDGSLVGSATAYFKAAVTNVFATTGTTRVRLYDMGTPTTPGTPRTISELVFASNGGPRSVEQALTVVSPNGETTNQILDSERVYEAAIVQDTSTTGDVAYIGSAVLEVR